MKRLFFFITLICISFNNYAQNDFSPKPLEERKHEVKLNGLFLIIGAFEGSYSYILNDESTIGISALLPIDKDISDDLNYYISPYYRFFFGKKPAAGFFLEGFGMLNSVNETNYNNFNETDPTVQLEEETITDFALGIGLGAKFLTKRGLVGEINAGVGRNLFNSKNRDFGTDIVGKLGISIGYRF